MSARTPLIDDLEGRLGTAQVTARAIDTARMAHDASHFLLQPQAVVVARDVADVQETVRAAARLGVPVTFRSGGTSLSGQAQSDGILIDTRKSFRDVEVLDGGLRVRCRPGATIRTVNSYLARHGRALGPDPASEVACTVGGVVANNSAGMACGTEFNTYRTLDSLEVVLPSGTLVDTALPDADARLRAAEPALHEGLARLRDRVRADPDSVARIRHQFSMKNTMGYGVNSFLDHDEPAQILAHLVVGSEGTLGFVASATFHTIPVLATAATALLVFDSIGDATRALPGLIEAGAAAAELMDAASLRVAQRLPASASLLAGIEIDQHTALLVDARADVDEELSARVNSLSRVLDDVTGLARGAAPRDDGGRESSGYFSTDPVRGAQAWAARKGLYTAVAGARPAGSTALLEDIVVPMTALPDTVRELQDLCGGYGYDDAVVFGHAKDANLHFMINPDLRDPVAVDTYARFTDDLVDLVLGADGSLKAEHGTGRIMAPFVRRQFGDELYAVMREVKTLADPRGVLNPGAVINDDPHVHLAHLKVSDPVDHRVDRCVECGYCEPVCPSRDVTTTPRQRIALMREMNQATPRRRAEIAADFEYEAVQTCAADALCLLNCPVGINTGVVMKGMRAERATPAAQGLGTALAEHWGGATDALRAGVDVADRLPPGLLAGLSGIARRVASAELVPAVGRDLPGPGVSRRTGARREPGDVVLLPSCLGGVFGPEPDGPPQEAPGASFAFLGLCDAAGVRVRIPDGVEGLCCGTVWRSKGLTDGAAVMARRTAQALLDATQDGRVPVVSDASSCVHGLGSLGDDLRRAGEDDLARRVEALEILDVTAFTHRVVLPRLRPRRVWRRAVVHPTCSDRHAGTTPELVALAEAVADEVIVPVEAGCCGFAGDRGMLHPELTAAATAREALEVAGLAGDVHLSTNRTCEMGMTRATGRPYHHVLEALHHAVAAAH